MKPRIFIASSVENLDMAYGVQENLEHSAECTVWDQNVFVPSKYSIESLVEALDAADFGIFIFAPDDVHLIRDESKMTVRDNVIFELGMFVGRLGKERNFILIPRNAQDLKLPTDLLGLTPALYDADRQDGNIAAALGPACNRIRKAVSSLGKQDVPPVDAVNHEPLISDPNDCISLLESWMGARPSSDNKRAIKFDDVDRELRLEPGSARTHIETAARKWNYRVVRRGQDTIMFEDIPYERGSNYF
ncbi:TIR domain-containing protein [Ancylobacter sp.]|uniref:TIR domain-containing protein n=1 Tax=Ancylobacter sp. TaxID=1872567 RepID=UPI003D13955A